MLDVSTQCFCVLIEKSQKCQVSYGHLLESGRSAVIKREVSKNCQNAAEYTQRLKHTTK